MADTKCRILCVDDHQDTSEVLIALLSHEDYEVVTARSFQEALERATNETFDLYVLDKRLPDGSGLELCQKLQQLTPKVPCILYSGDAYEIHRQEALQAGADAYVAKPDIEASSMRCADCWPVKSARLPPLSDLYPSYDQLSPSCLILRFTDSDLLREEWV